MNPTKNLIETKLYMNPTLKTYTFKVFLKNKKEQYINDYLEKLSSDGQHFNKHDNINKTCTQTATSHLKPMNFKKKHDICQ